MTETKADQTAETPFLRDEDGAVTVDWVVLAAAVMLLSIPVLTTIKGSTETAAGDVASDMIAATD
ncbi:hypothetical protein G5V65_09345 [Rhodobacter sp. HX-7-19]|uniref:Pilus assembly protein n=1 Tax=Paragemmobacter kunshanensis TaxID=2583234 RepID=A0A6M1U9H9_9RHOB|nr:hypothetical protein [Rhodobacter kunshanensis]NGQ91101.1 hypothetical protein [Rhodobacter kunshanensis]